MGSRLAQFFHEAHRLGGVSAKIRLAARAHMTSVEAAFADDDPEVIAHFSRLLEDLRTAYHEDPSLPNGTEGQATANPATPITAMVLRRHLQGVLDLLGQRALATAELRTSLQRVNEVAASALDVARTSIWLLDENHSLITCADLFLRETGTHEAGAQLSARDYPTYFAALHTERTIAAHDARSDPRTACLTADYLTPLGIVAMLDVPIWVRDRMRGVICHEHIDTPRVWTTDDETFAYLMSNFVATALELRDP